MILNNYKILIFSVYYRTCYSEVKKIGVLPLKSFADVTGNVNTFEERKKVDVYYSMRNWKKTLTLLLQTSANQQFFQNEAISGNREAGNNENKGVDNILWK